MCRGSNLKVRKHTWEWKSQPRSGSPSQCCPLCRGLCCSGSHLRRTKGPLPPTFQTCTPVWRQAKAWCDSNVWGHRALGCGGVVSFILSLGLKFGTFAVIGKAQGGPAAPVRVTVLPCCADCPHVFAFRAKARVNAVRPLVGTSQLPTPSPPTITSLSSPLRFSLRLSLPFSFLPLLQCPWHCAAHSTGNQCLRGCPKLSGKSDIRPSPQPRPFLESQVSCLANPSLGRTPSSGPWREGLEPRQCD